MTTTAWAHLPNAKYIDRIIEDVKINPDKWSVVKWSVVYDAAYEVALEATREAARVAVYDAASRDPAWAAAWGAILSLIAWDDCGELLNADPEQVQILALLGDEKAILLYPASVALQKEIA